MHPFWLLVVMAMEPLRGIDLIFLLSQFPTTEL